jgi:hypothetical protein
VVSREDHDSDVFDSLSDAEPLGASQRRFVCTEDVVLNEFEMMGEVTKTIPFTLFCIQTECASN